MDEANSLAGRQSFVDQLTKDVDSAEHWVDSMLTKFGWDKDTLLQQQVDVGVCPFDPGHQMPRTSLPLHTEVCKWRKKGLTKDDMEKVPSSAFFYEKSKTVIQMNIDERTQAEILSKVPAGANGIPHEVPLTTDQAICEMTPVQRMAIYDYCVNYAKEKASRIKISDEELLFQKGKDEDRPNREKSRLEIKAEERDLKRRRKSYRAKNVHITRKSATEILREVITNQMEMLAEMWKDDKEEEEREAAFAHGNRRSRSEIPRRSHYDHEDSRSPDSDRGYTKRERDSNIKTRNYSSRSRSKSPSRSRRVKRERSRSRESEGYWDERKTHIKQERLSREREVKHESGSQGRDFDVERSSSRSRSRSRERRHKHKKHKKHKHKHKHKSGDRLD